MTNQMGVWAPLHNKGARSKCICGVIAAAALTSSCSTQTPLSQEDTSSRTRSAITAGSNDNGRNGNGPSAAAVSDTARLGQRTAQMQQDAAAVARIADQYIVVFKPGVVSATSGRRIQDIATAVQSRHGGKVIHRYSHALHGLAMKLSATERESLSADSQVAYIVPDGIATAVTDQTNATWGLDRIDQRQLPLNQTYSYPTDGTGVHAYVIDTGINATHTEFTGGPGGASRIGLGYDFVDNDNDPTDCYGHGTHVAGTIGGTTYGVAKQVTLHGVRVLDCGGSGAWSTVIAGIDWVTANHVSPAVANMSLGGSFNQAINDAVTNSIASGVTYAIAAGNSSSDACSFSPASTGNALTVGATDSTDTRASFSNYGTCVDIFAPGYSITSAWIGSNTATNTINGTSMATPHVAGAAALYLGLNPGANPAQVAAVLTSRATLNAVLNPGTGSPNRLLYMSNLAAPTDQVPPTAAITSPADGQAVTGVVSVTAAAADDAGTVTSVEFYVNGVLKGLDTAAPWEFSWDSGAVPTGTYQLTAIATDDSGNRGTSAPITVSVSNPGQATYDAVLKAPVCGTVGNNCTTGALINGRGMLGEPNTPNTLLSSCTDGNAGTYHYDESLDRLRVYTLDGSNIAAGKSVRIEATVWSWTASGADNLDLYYASDANAASWTFLTTINATAAGALTFTYDYVLPPTGAAIRAIRGNFRYSTVAGSCTAGSYDDRDDLAFAVDGGTPPINTAPVVSAGPDLTVTQPNAAALNGTVSDDGLPNPPGAVIATWSAVSGPGAVTFTNANAAHTTATFSIPGTYVLRLTASDSALSSSDDVTVTVNSANQAPVVNAGADLSVALPNTAALHGTATDDGLPNPPGALTTTWSVVSGPGTVTFGNSAAADTTAAFTAPGMYVLRLTASDSALSSSDDAVVTVSSANQAPAVNAGPDLAVTLPGAATLNGTVSDDGLPNPPAAVTIAWSKVSGPGTVTFGNASAANTTATFSAAGSYVLQLTANDGALASSDTATVVVSAANTAPVVNAGPDLSITLPATATLNGTATDDGKPTPPMLTITWSKTSGPGTVTFTSPSASISSASFSTSGTYVLRLTASDGALSSYDEVQVTVNAAATNPCASLCSNPTNFTVNGSYQLSNLGTGAICYQTTSVVHSGNCGNFASPRILTVNGTTMTCNGSNWSSLPAVRNGGYCVQTTTGNYSYAYFTMW